MIAHRAVLPVVLGAVAITVIVWRAWPRPVDAELRAAYAELERAPVPALVVGAVVASEPRLQLSSSGYALSVRAADLGEVTITGQRAVRTENPTALSWREGDVTYKLETAADPGLVRARVVPVAEARRQLVGGGWDTPLLYLLYLPALIGFACWATWSLLLRPTQD